MVPFIHSELIFNSLKHQYLDFGGCKPWFLFPVYWNLFWYQNHIPEYATFWLWLTKFNNDKLNSFSPDLRWQMNSYKFLSWVKFINSSYGRTPNFSTLKISEKNFFSPEKHLQILLYSFTFPTLLPIPVSRTCIFCTDLVFLRTADTSSPSLCLRLSLFTSWFTCQHLFYQCSYKNNIF